jgi:hypothetical protein
MAAKWLFPQAIDALAVATRPAFGVLDPVEAALPDIAAPVAVSLSRFSSRPA